MSLDTYVRCVTPAPSSIRVLSSSIGSVPRWSNNRTPSPSRTGTRSTCISSRSPALLHEARADHADVLVACDRFRLLYGAFETVRDERERRSFGNPLLVGLYG